MKNINWQLSNLELSKKLKVKLPCLNCGTIYEFDEDSNEAKNIFNVFCSDKDCEDEYAFKL